MIEAKECKEKKCRNNGSTLAFDLNKHYCHYSPVMGLGEGCVAKTLFSLNSLAPHVVNESHVFQSVLEYFQQS
jgi:hypothetical protein